MHAQTGSSVTGQRQADHLQAKMPLRKTGYCVSIWNPSPKNCEKINICHLIHMVCGALSWLSWWAKFKGQNRKQWTWLPQWNSGTRHEVGGGGQASFLSLYQFAVLRFRSMLMFYKFKIRSKQPGWEKGAGTKTKNKPQQNVLSIWQKQGMESWPQELTNSTHLSGCPESQLQDRTDNYWKKKKILSFISFTYRIVRWAK